MKISDVFIGETNFQRSAIANAVCCSVTDANAISKRNGNCGKHLERS